MSTGKGLFAGLALVAISILIVGLSGQSRALGTGSVQVSSASWGGAKADTIGAFIVNTETGAVRLCQSEHEVGTTIVPAKCTNVPG